MRHAEEVEYGRAQQEHSLAVSEGVAREKVYESFFAGGWSAVDNRHLMCVIPRPYWSTQVQMLNRRT